MRSIVTPLQIARNLLRQAEGWFTFVELPIDAGTFRLVDNEENLDANGVRWMACGMRIEFPEEDREGKLGELTISIPNVSQLAMAYVEVDDEVLGRFVTVWLQHESNLDAFDPQLSWTHRVLDAELGEKLATFHCGHSATIQQVPAPIYSRSQFPQLLRRGGIRL